jgi:hypothetical protein
MSCSVPQPSRIGLHFARGWLKLGVMPNILKRHTMDKKTDRIIYLINKAQEQFSEEHLVLAVPDFISKKFIAFCAMKEDLELILIYIDEIRSNPSWVIKSALSYSLIALYGKCFTDASKSGFPRLEPTDLFSADETHYETHNRLMELRHQFIAHRGDLENEIGISFMLVSKKDSLDKSQVHFSQVKMVSFSNEDLDKFKSLLKFVIEKLLEKIQKSGQKVHDGMLRLFTPEQLALMLVNGVK